MIHTVHYLKMYNTIYIFMGEVKFYVFFFYAIYGRVEQIIKRSEFSMNDDGVMTVNILHYRRNV